jgi:hypothetical protein
MIIRGSDYIVVKNGLDPGETVSFKVGWKNAPLLTFGIWSEPLGLRFDCCRNGALPLGHTGDGLQSEECPAR